MAFRMTERVDVQRADDGTVRKLRHPAQPYAAEDSATFAARSVETAEADAGGPSLRQLADDYLREVMPIYGMDAVMAADLDASFAAAPEPEVSSRLQFMEENDMPNQATVAYAQTHMGLPVWESGFAVKLAGSPPRVVGSQSSMDSAVDVEPPPEDAPFDADRLDAETVARLLGLGPDTALELNGTRRLIYRLDADDRGNAAGGPEPADAEAEAGEADEADGVDETMMHVPGPTLPLPDLPEDLEDGRHYVVLEVLFTLTGEPWGETNFGAFVEPRTGAVLRVDSFVGCLHHGHVYLADPPTRSGSTVRPTSRTDLLDGLRERVELPGLTPPAAGEEQSLEGEYVRLVDVERPHATPPTRADGDDFDDSVPTDDFAAVNAYYHCDRLFRLLEGMGLDVTRYFDGTNFPVPVDHRVGYRISGVFRTNVVNASAPGNRFRTGSDGFRFALVERDTDVGMALHWRVVLHEFGHAILWDHVSSPNFRFAHSAGDSLAAILSDPDSLAPDRFLTFPWTPIERRHDRRPEDGWAWGGRRDDAATDRAGYDREQILSTTLFRLYRSLGGDHTDPAERRRAARYAAYLIFVAVGTLSRVAQPADAEDFADNLMDADLALPDFEGRAGGAAHKAIRWAFEQQGAYSRSSGEVRGPGEPPAVDVYLDDGRSGTYEPGGSYLFSTADVWNRRSAGGGGTQATVHEDPVAGRENFLFVRVRNRGTSDARGVEVSAFTSRDGGDRAFPDAWTATDHSTGGAAARAAADVAAGGEQIVGPLRWTPGPEGAVAVLVSVDADGDASNVHTLNAPLAAALLAHLDNNVAGRMMRVVSAQEADAGTGNGDGDGDGDVTTTQAATQPRLPIPDADPAGAVSLLHVSTEGTIRRLGMGVTILHTFIGDLLVTLTSPAGTEVVVFEGRGFDQSEDDVRLTLSSDRDAVLQAFVGERAEGAWSLRAVDRIGIDTGTLERWSLALVVEP